MISSLRFVITGTFFILTYLVSHAQSQELKINVTIDASQLSDLQASIVTDMKQQITGFMNDRQWTKDNFQQEERIICNFALILTGQPSPFNYEGTLQLQIIRPVYGTAYQSILLNFIDKSFTFGLNQGEQLNFNENSFNSNLTSMLGFYAYIILALDYDSYGKLSGQPFIEKAYNIANVAVQAGGGWATSGDPNNRFSLIENLNSQLLVPFREGFYAYHRLALDTYLKDPDASRLKIIEMLRNIKKVNQVKPYSILIRSFFLAKRDELINIYRDGSDEIKEQIVPLLKELDPLNSERYNTILQKR